MENKYLKAMLLTSVSGCLEGLGWSDYEDRLDRQMRVWKGKTVEVKVSALHSGHLWNRGNAGLKVRSPALLILILTL